MRTAAHLCFVLALALLSGVVAAPLLAQPSSFPSRAVLDANNMVTWLSEDGSFPFRNPGDQAGIVYPKGAAGIAFTQGFLWGGIRVAPDGSRRVLVNGSVYTDGLTPGKVRRDPETGAATEIGDSTDAARFHVWRVHRAWNTMDFREAAATHFGVAPEAVSEEQREQIRAWYAYDWEHWPAEDGAPYEERNGTPGYQAATFDVVTGVWMGDLPGYPGADQTLWTVSHDFTASRVPYGSEPLGMEYQVTLWAYASHSPGRAFRHTHFARHRLIYTGLPDTPEGTRIDSMFVSKFADPDVGDYADDFAGSDSLRDLGYAYNAGATDAQYQSGVLAPPALGWKLLQGPAAAEGDTLGMTAFWHKATGDGGGDPEQGAYEGTLQWFNVMRGYRTRPAYPAGSPILNPATSQPEPIMMSGDPVTAQGWIDGAHVPPGDRRFVMSSGPFSMALGDTVDVVYAQIGAIGTSNLNSVNVLKGYADQLQSAPSTPTDAAEPEGHVSRFRLRGNAPNPFGASTLISFDLPAAAEVSVAVYDVLGRQVADVPARPFAPGPAQSVRLDASGLPSGVYVYRVRAEQAGRVEIGTGRLVVAR